MRINNPVIPFSGPIPGGLKPGLTLYFKGTVQHNITCFNINLGDGCNKAMHFKPCFKPGAMVVFNTFRRHRWEREDRVNEMPFTMGQSFVLLFTVTVQGYQVDVNGVSFHLFKHRMPMERVTLLEIGDGVSMATVLIGEELIEIEKPICGPEIEICGFRAAPPAKELVNPNMEYIHGGLRYWMSVCFKGTVPQEAESFSINLLCGSDQNNAFFFNPQFHSEVVEFNSMREGSWESKESSEGMPFRRGEDFEMSYYISEEGYQVNVNNNPFYFFKHRMPLEDVTAITFNLDVNIKFIDIIEGGEGGMHSYLSQGRMLVPKEDGFSGFIYGGLKEGMYLYFRGTVNQKAGRFDINLQTSQQPGSDIAMHFNPRFTGQPVVVFNTLTGGTWQREERLGLMPFCKGKSFEILFYVDKKGYRVHVNGNPVHIFNHRIPLEDVNTITINGDVSMDTVDIIEGGKGGVAVYRGLRTISIPKIPHVVPIMGGLRVGTHLYFQGMVPVDANRFSINLQWGQPGSVITLHFNPRFTPTEVVVFNTLQLKWGNEERVNKMPFSKGESFEVVIIVTTVGYQVIVNGHPFYLFKHRDQCPEWLVSALYIDGDVSMQTVQMINGVQGALVGHRSLGKMAITKMPHVGPIYGGLRIGMALYFKGTVPQGSDRFSINLQLGQSDSSDIAFHFNPRFTSNDVRFNTRRDGQWENEEQSTDMPFHEGEGFEIFFIVTAQGFQVNVNGRQFHVFLYRMPLELVSAIMIDGVVTMETVDITEGVQGALVGHRSLGKIAITKMPHLGLIYGGLRIGMALYFKGTVPQGSDRFSINLKLGQSDSSDIAFHFNPRFTSNDVRFNTRRDGQWENEEQSTDMPFHEGEGFEIVFIVTAQGFQVNVNGRQFHVFLYRMPLELVSAIMIDGVVTMETVDITEGFLGALVGHRSLGKMAITKMPHVGLIYGGLRIGMALYFKGTVPQGSDRFHINLQLGQSDSSDIAFHFNPRFTSNDVRFNTRRDGQWENEEQSTDMPFHEGEGFEIVFIVTAQGFQVNVNGRQFHVFLYRMPLELVSAIMIDGVVTMEIVDITKGVQGALAGHRSLEKMAITKMPHVGAISGGLRIGMALYFKGTVPQGSDRFSINLQSGQSDSSDIAFHFNPRFTSNDVRFNTRRDGQWENEEQSTDMPFHEGEGFEIVYIVTAQGFQVSVNGRQFHLFLYRMPLELVSAIMIDGVVTMEIVDITEGFQGSLVGHRSLGKMAITKMPHVGAISGGLRIGMALYFKGTVPQGSDRFHINLQLGQSDSSDIAFHFNPRFTSNDVRFNTRRDGQWENEEQSTDMPFHEGEGFEIVFIVTAEGFQVNVNGRQFHIFLYRMPLELVRAIMIDGVVTMETVDITEEGLREIEKPACGFRAAPPAKELVNPNMEYILGGLRYWMSVCFKGTVPQEAESFSINLLCGSDQNNAFFFNPQFNSEVVEFNSMREGSWESKESSEGMPFRRGEDFEMSYYISEEGYQVNVNNNPFYFFKHRMPLEDVTAITFNLDVNIKIIELIEGGEGGMHSYLSQGRMLVPKEDGFTGFIYGGLKEGMYLYFRGTVNRKAERFDINLQTSQQPGCNIAMHFNPRFTGQPVVVFNTLTGGTWQREERPGLMPFCKGKSFEILFYVDKKGYRVHVNGNPVHIYNHRIPLEDVNTIAINGDVSMDTVDIIEGGKGGVAVYRGLRTISIPKIPHVVPIMGGLRVGTHLYFQGMVPVDANRFSINLQWGQPGSVITLHFNPRFTPTEVVVFNTLQLQWGNEERVNKMPFSKGESFEVVIIVTTVGYQVIVNGHPFYLFKHRDQCPEWLVSALYIDGDVSMETVQMINGVQGALEGHPSLGKMAITKMPHVGAIYGGLRIGMALYFKGTVPQGSDRFSINLQLGQSDSSDIAFHFNPRFTSNDVRFNTRRDGQWENEEQSTDMPFHEGEDFEIVFIVTAQGFQVNVNGRQFHVFLYRMSLELVSAIMIDGVVTMETVDIIEAGKLKMPRHLGLGRMTIDRIPFVGTVQGCLRTGMYMYFRGKVPQQINGFCINLQYGQVQGVDKALHFNPRFDPEEVVVFNSFRNGSWQQEERVYQMPFRKGDDFEIVIIVTQIGYQVIINGHLLYLFKHRMPVELVTAVEIAGDISMESLNLIQRGHALAEKREMAVSRIPYGGPIYGGLRTGMFIFFRGFMPQEIDSFSINLQYGELEGSDIALHFNPRYDSNVVVFNTFRNDQWEKEERVHDIPLERGANYELLFIITPLGYQVTINGRPFLFFAHRMPVDYVSAIRIVGDIGLEALDTTGPPLNEFAFQGERDAEEQEGLPDFGRLIVDKCSFGSPLLHPLRTGMAVIFKGRLNEQFDNFTINLQCGQISGCDTALEFHPMMTSSPMVTFNSYRNGQWGEVENVYEMPFTRGKEFEIIFLITSVGYQVFVNGVKFYLFRHRMPVGVVSAIQICGDPSVETIDMRQQEPEEDEKVPVEKAVVPSASVVGPIHGGLRPGMSIYFKGTVPDDSSRFNISLMSMETEGYDIIFYFSPRFETSSVVFNTQQNGVWDDDERLDEIPFRRGEAFELLFVITSEGYQVKVNGTEFYLFKHRIPVERVAFIRVFEDVSMQIISVIEGGQEGIPEQPSLGSMVVSAIPHVGPIYGGVRKGMYLYFRGRIHDDINRFDINLQYGDGLDSEIALHFNPRFEPTQVVVFNTLRNGSWEAEERVDEMPFTKGEDFELVFMITPKGYQVMVNGRMFYLFMHRMPVEQVRTLAIGGDVSIDSINTFWSGPRSILGYRGIRNISVTNIPHVEPIFGGLRTGTYLYFRGTVPESSKDFVFSLRYGEGARCDMPLYFRPLFEPSVMVAFSSQRNGKWDDVDAVMEMPFTKGEEFELVFIITSEGYQVVVNGRLYHFFKHRLPVELVRVLMIEGDVIIHTANMVMGGTGGMHASLGEIVVTEIPHVGPVYGGLRSGMYLYFKGTIPQQISTFAINLQYGQVEGCDIALHFNPRFEPSEVVVFNTLQNGNWQQEETVDAMPFTKGEDFELLIILTTRGYQVNVNGRQFYLFKHRMPVEHVRAVKITGDITIETGNITEGGQEEEQPDEEGIVTIPHLRSFHGGLRAGMYLYFQGTIPQDINRFSINLQYGQTKDANIALHFNPRFDTAEEVVFNTLKNGSWENEEKPTEMPFHKGEDFEIFIFVTSKGYQVNVNGRQFYLFNHRMPVDQVTALNISGDVTMHTINLIRGGPKSVPGQPGLGKVAVTKIPHVGPVYGGLRPGMYLYFWGIIPHTIESFCINLQCGQLSGCDIALHFNPRFQPSEVVVFNSFRNGNWEAEERVDVMPFQKGGRFELVFIITPEGYQVVVNGRPFYLFKHRLPLEHVTAVNIAGDVSMETINTINSGPKQGQPSLGKMVISTIPHVGPVYGGLRPGMALYFRGTLHQDINSFGIVLQCGELDASDKAFLFNPRFQPSGVVVFNSFRNGKWENEERVTEMPFVPGESFELLIMVMSKGYKVKVNGRVFYTFLHRMPVQYVSAVKIVGDITMETGEITEGGEEEEEVPKVIPSIPLMKVISGGLVPGMALYFIGTIPKKFSGFNINLNCWATVGSDIALHFNPRFESSSVVFNSFQGGCWQEEEVVKEMPFHAGEDFELIFIITLEGYQVKINGNEFHFFKHRIPVVSVAAIKIGGDVTIQRNKITEGGTATMEGRLIQEKMVVNAMPFVGYLLSSLKTGMTLCFRGIMPKEINRFSISLECGEREDCEKALLFKAQFQPSEVVVFNSFQNGTWLTEEKVDGIPFRKGKSFELLFVVTKTGYQVMANGRRFFLFKHRIPVDRVSCIKIGGDFAIETMEMSGGAIQGSRGLQKTAVTIPHVGPIYNGLRAGMYLYFRGNLPQETDGFTINLQYGQVDDSDIALHFSAQFQSSVVKLNSFRNGNWGNEERPTEFPFSKGEYFEVLIIVTSEGYQLNVNGRSYFFFKHRMPVEYVSALRITGNVSMQPVYMIGGGEGALHPSLAKMAVTDIPHIGPIYGGLKTGMYLTFKGTLPEEMTSFSIYLKYGQVIDADVALHFNPQMDSDRVVFNMCQGGNWGEEETASEMPFQKGKDFEIVFLIGSEGYQVYVNGRHFHLYKHRIPAEHVCALLISGEVTIQEVDMIERGEAAPSLLPAEPKVVSTTPHLEPIPGGLRPGTYLYFKGTVPQDVDGFSINLQYGQIEGCDIALHFNPRFATDVVVVLNSHQSGSWGSEEKPSEMPFTKGEDFELVFIVTVEGYQVFVNGRNLYFFKHRMPVETVSAIRILGDVAIEHMNIIEGGQRQIRQGQIEIASIPHVEPTYGGLRPGMYLYFKGTVPQELNSFSINLQYGQVEGSDIAFHFKPIFEPSPMVVFNSFKNGSWEPSEESVDVMPLTKGEEFEVLYIITLEGYQVNINGRQFYLFKHRMPVEHVSAINITGDISMQTLNIVPGGQNMAGHGTIEVPAIPHVGPVYGGLRPGMALFFHGTTPDDIESFAINLQYGTMKGSDIAFHFNPRFEPSERVVFNSLQNGNWGEEESVEEMPFVPGESFEMAFLITVEGYQVVINGQRYYLFKHRIPVEQVSAIEITGTIFIQSANMIAGEDVQIEEKPVEEEEEEPEILLDVEHVPNLVIGKALCVKGTIPSEITSFAFNLRCGGTKDSDIAFHFNPRFEQMGVWLNSCENGSWGTEEIVYEMPFNKGQSFELVYIITPEGYQVYVNRRQFYFFKHRIPVEKINTFQIIGDVFIQATNCINEVEVQKEDEKDVSSEVLAKTELIPNGLGVGSILISGAITQDITRFSIDLSCGDTAGSDIAYRLSPQFKPSEMMVFNSFQNGQWGEEQIVEDFPFPKENFFVLILTTPIGYQLLLNAIPVHMFEHRMEMSQVRSIKIYGNVSILNISLQQESEPEPEEEVKEVIQSEVPVSGSLKTGTTLTFKGVIPQESKKFSINLPCADTPGCDIAFYFNVQFETSIVTFNSFRNGVWEEAEVVESMPFVRGETYVLVYFITIEGYQVIINGTEFYFFKHRIPLELVRGMQFTGDISAPTISLEEGAEHYPSPSEMGTIQSQAPITGTLKTETTLTFQGVVPDVTKRFSINLQCGDSIQSDIAFHFSAQFETSMLVFNTYRNGSWEEAEVVEAMPFTLGQSFVVIYIITLEGYQVNINGTDIYFFKHRIPLEQVRGLYVAGDVLMKIVNVEEPIPKYPSPAQLGPVQAVAPMPGNLKVGMSMIFKGIIPMDITRFCINLQTGMTDTCDTAFHMNVLFETSEVVFNSFRNGSWEEAETLGVMPFTKGQSFVLALIITAEGYQININDELFHLYLHRISFDLVRCLQVIGDVTLEPVNIIQETIRSNPARIGTVQSVVPIPSTLKAGTSMSFGGTIPEDLSCFCINLQCGDSDDSDTAFHFRPLIETSEVVFNSFQNGAWDEQEKVHEMPFSKGQSFMLLINITSQGYQVMVNGNQLYLFRHRIPVESVTVLQIIGNVSIESVGIIETAPSVTPLPSGMGVGASVTFLGSIPFESNGFSIDLLCGSAAGSDVAFHFAPQFDPSREVVFNSFQNGSWETEERIDVMPFNKGGEFELTFIISSEGYQVNINREVFHVFNHRIPVEQVRALQIDGNVNIPTVNIMEARRSMGGAFDMGCCDQMGGISGAIVTVESCELDVMDYFGPILVRLPGGGKLSLKVGTTVFIRVTIPSDTTSFAIELWCGEEDGSDVAFRIATVFDPSHEVRFECYYGNEFPPPEYAARTPLIRGESHEVSFTVTNQGYQVQVDGVDLHTYAHRVPVERVTIIKVFGSTIKVDGASMIQMPVMGSDQMFVSGGAFDMGSSDGMVVCGGAFDMGSSDQMAVSGSMDGQWISCGTVEMQEF